MCDEKEAASIAKVVTSLMIIMVVTFACERLFTGFWNIYGRTIEREGIQLLEIASAVLRWGMIIGPAAVLIGFLAYFLTPRLGEFVVARAEARLAAKEANRDVIANFGGSEAIVRYDKDGGMTVYDPTGALVDRVRGMSGSVSDLAGLLTGLGGMIHPAPVSRTGRIENNYGSLPAPELPDLASSLPEFVRIEDYVRPESASLRSLFLGIGPGGEQIRGSLFQLSHIGNGGTSQWGKSNFLQNLLYQILLATEPSELFLSDLGGTSFVDFGIPYADTVAGTEKMADYLWQMAQERKALYQKTGVGIKSIEHYNRLTGESLSYAIFACDEVTVAFGESKKLQRQLTHLVTFAAKYGIEIILSGQNWKTTNVDSTLRDQFSSRFQFKAMDRHQGAILIPDAAAHEITVKGRCFCWIPERGEVLQMQTPYVSSEILQTVAKPVHPILPGDMPMWDISGDEDDREPTPREKIICELYQSGASLKQISEQINEGRYGGWYYDKIREVLQKFELLDG